MKAESLTSEIHTPLAPGARVVVRDAEWLVRRVDRTSTGGQALAVVGISELVRDKEAVFLTEIDKGIEVLDPGKTSLVPDTSSAYQASLLYPSSWFSRVQGPNLGSFFRPDPIISICYVFQGVCSDKK